MKNKTPTAEGLTLGDGPITEPVVMALIRIEREIAIARAVKHEAKFAKEVKQKNDALSKGRKQGAQTQKEYAAETWKIVETLNADLLNHPDTARCTLDSRATYIERKLIESGRKQLNGKPYTFATIKKRITGKSDRPQISTMYKPVA